MVIGIVTSSSVESLLNNLSETGFDKKQISLVMHDVQLRNTIADDVGPFKGVTLATLPQRLAELGLSSAEVKTWTDAVAHAKVLVVIACSLQGEPTAAEMLKDASAEFIKVVRK